MMLVIRSRGGCGLGRYSGSGILDAVSRQLFSSGFKKAISSGVNSTLAHKVVDAVVNGANSTALQKFGKAVVKGETSAGERAAESIVNNVINSTKKWIVGKKRSSSAAAVADSIIVPQKRKLNNDILLDVSGIVLD